MAEAFTTWIVSNHIELSGAVLGILYIFFSIRQHILTWPVGLATSVLYIIVFYRSGFYADMGLQFYYVFISIYGWYYWIKGKETKKKEDLHVTRMPKTLIIKAAAATLLIYGLMLFILRNYTDSTVPFMDSFTTALSITATWMLARKYIEHWFVWIIVDTVSAGLYVYKELWPTVVLFIIYTVMAVIGYIQWKKDYNKDNKIL